MSFHVSSLFISLYLLSNLAGIHLVMVFFVYHVIKILFELIYHQSLTISFCTTFKLVKKYYEVFKEAIIMLWGISIEIEKNLNAGFITIKINFLESWDEYNKNWSNEPLEGFHHIFLIFQKGVKKSLMMFVFLL